MLAIKYKLQNIGLISLITNVYNDNNTKLDSNNEHKSIEALKFEIAIKTL